VRVPATPDIAFRMAQRNCRGGLYRPRLQFALRRVLTSRHVAGIPSGAAGHQNPFLLGFPSESAACIVAYAVHMTWVAGGNGDDLLA
jgi:hypothetical protein